MATTGRGNYPANSDWVSKRRRKTKPMYQNIGLGGGTAQRDIFVDWFFEASSGVNHYTLAATATSFSVTGVSSGIKLSRKLTSTTQTYSTSGATGVKADRKLQTSAQTYSVVGNNANISKTTAITHYTLTCDVLPVVVSSSQVNARAARKVITTSQSYSVLGVQGGIKTARKLPATSSLYSISSGTSILRFGRRMVVESCSYGVEGTTSVTAQRVLGSVPSPYSVTGNDASLLYGTSTYYGVLRRYNGASWTKADLRVFNGSTWEQKALRVWSGSSWENVDTTGV